jgi:hypothetical protein
MLYFIEPELPEDDPAKDFVILGLKDIEQYTRP